MSVPIVVNRAVDKDDFGSEIPRDTLVASPWHTAFVLVMLGLYAYWGTIRAARALAGLGPSRPTIYLRTIFFELLFLGIVLAGVKLRGASLQAVLGQRWKSAGQVFVDLGLGIALLFLSTLLVSHPWRTPTRGRGEPFDPVFVAPDIFGDGNLGAYFDHGGDLRRSDLPRLLAAAVGRADAKCLAGNRAFVCGVWRRASLSRRATRGRDCGVGGYVWRVCASGARRFVRECSRTHCRMGLRRCC